MSYFQARAKKIEPGRYQLSYGKGKKKLEAVIETTDNHWKLTEGDGADSGLGIRLFKRKKDLVSAWGEWAQEEYGSDEPNAERSQTDNGQPSEPKPAPPSRKGPPKRTRKGPPKRNAARKGPPKRKPVPTTLEFQFGADPFDARFKYPSDHEQPELRKHLTPLGLLVEIEKWVQRYGKMVEGVPAFDPLIDNVREVLARECPDLLKDNSDEQQEEETDEAERTDADDSGGESGNEAVSSTLDDIPSFD